MTPFFRLAERTARIVVKDEEELLKHEIRLHAHLMILFAGACVLTYVLMADMGEMTLLIVTWTMSGCQEFIDYKGRL